MKLEAVRVGRELVTTREAIGRFFRELTLRSGVKLPAEEGELPTETDHKLRAAGLLP